MLFAFAIPSDALRKKHYNINSEGLAIDGYDPVAYQTLNAAKEGRTSFSYTYHGITYRFISWSNLTKFKANPETYEPAYGGWCAYAMGNSGEKVEIDPKTFKVINGKTYLFYNAYFNNTKTKWNENEAALKKKADANWTKIVK